MVEENIILSNHTPHEIVQLPPIDREIFATLLSLLNSVKLTNHIPDNHLGHKSNRCRVNFPPHRADIFGYVKLRPVQGGGHDLSRVSKSGVTKPLIYDEVFRLGKLLCPIPFSSVLINNNTVCGKHKDKNNAGKSMLVSIGDYTGCKIVIEGVEYDTNYTPIIFDGCMHEHWNTDDLVGNKYSLVFYNILDDADVKEQPRLIKKKKQIEHDYVILVITHNRVERCYKKTLTMLKDNGIPEGIITLVVHDAEQKSLYEEGIPKEYYNEILITNKNDGIYGQMNWMYEKYNSGQKILKLDDDISAILRLQGDKLVKTYDLPQIIDEGFKLCTDNGYKLWGIYPSSNAYFMKSPKNYTTDLRFIVGALMGFINEKITLDLDIKIKGDYEYAIQSYMNNGGIIRFNKITFKYDIAKNEGERINTMINDADILTKKYPDLVRMNARRNNKKNMGEILLNNKNVIYKEEKKIPIFVSSAVTVTLKTVRPSKRIFKTENPRKEYYKKYYLANVEKWKKKENI